VKQTASTGLPGPPGGPWRSPTSAPPGDFCLGTSSDSLIIARRRSVRCNRPTASISRCIRVATVLLVLAGTWLPGLPTLALAADQAVSAPSATTAATDTAVVILPDLIVGAGDHGSADPAQVYLSNVLIEAQDPVAVDDLGPLLPATRVILNSRGESLFMVRGASERHVRIWLDDIPLVVPWDERVDLSLVPVLAVTGSEASRGVVSALDGVGTLAGSVRLRTDPVGADGHRVVVDGAAGQVDAYRGGLLYRTARGSWDFGAAVARRTRSGVTVPADLDAPYHQTGDVRTNSDLEQTALLIRGGGPLGAGSLNLLVLGTDGAKGVPPETHLDEEARFWRYPLQQRLLAGAALTLPLDHDRQWHLDSALSADLFRQEIRPYDDDTYTGPPLEPGAPLESDHDGTGYGRVRIRRHLGGAAELAAQAETRYTQHRETLTVGGPQQNYSQWLTSFVAEASGVALGDWLLTAGGGWEFAATPETGDKPARAATDAAVAHLDLAYAVTDRSVVHGTASRRSRFPSLREMFSGALGRFEPNPELRAERQDLFEIGISSRGPGWDLGGAAFASYLDGGIEKVVLPDSAAALYTRVNRTQIRTLGLEALAGWRPSRSLSLTGHYTLLDARVRQGGAYTRPAEDRPNYLATVTCSYDHRSGIGGAVEWHILGPRHGADPTAPGGLRRLPAQGRWNLRIDYTAYPAPDWLGSIQLYVRFDNVFDQLVTSQVGLPEPGRMVSIGAKLRLGS